MFLLIISFFIYNTNLKRIIQLILIIALGLIILILISYSLNIEGFGLIGSIKSLFRRAFYVPSYTVFQYFEVFTKMHDFLYGKSINLYTKLFKKEFINAANLVYKIYYPQKIETGLVNTCFIGESYANFGFIGVYIESIILGFLLNFYNYFTIYIISDEKKNIISLMFQSLIFPILIINLNSSSIFTSHLTHGIVIIIIISSLFNIFRKTWRYNEKKNLSYNNGS
ncbi:MAG: hypothetical protein QXP60_08760 [Nitrososphaerota archaeon]